MGEIKESPVQKIIQIERGGRQSKPFGKLSPNNSSEKKKKTSLQKKANQ